MNKTSAAFWTEANRLQGIQLSLIRQIMASAPRDAINLALGELGFPMPAALKEKAIDLLRAGNPAYTPNAGLPELRSAIADRHQTLPAGVVVTNGAEEALFIAVMALTNPGDTIAIPDPDYPAYPAIARIFDNRIVRLPLQADFLQIDWDIWEQALQDEVKVILLSAPSNPSGFYFDEANAIKFGDLCNRYGITVIVDEIYAPLYFDAPPVSLLGKVERLIRIGGLSKSHALSGWRLGWLLGPKELAASFTKARQYISTCGNWLAQQLAVYALTEEGMKLVEDIRKQLSLNRQTALDRFHSLLPPKVKNIHAPSATPYMLLQVEDDLHYANLLAAKGVISVPGRAFGKATIGWVRINIGVTHHNLSDALEIIYSS